MFYTSSSNRDFFRNLDLIGMKSEINTNKSVLIKINWARVYTKNHPRTDMVILKNTIDYIYQNGGTCAVTEGADGYLHDNLVASGLESVLKHYEVKIIDADIEDFEELISFGEHHYIPKCFKNYPIRIAIPSTSKRKDMYYSNNIKLFVGAVPRKMYQLEYAPVNGHVPRPRLHQNLDTSIASLFLAMEAYSPFHFYINGGLSFNENKGEFRFDEIFIGNDALELDLHLYQNFFSDCDYPKYLDIVKSKSVYWTDRRSLGFGG